MEGLMKIETAEANINTGRPEYAINKIAGSPLAGRKPSGMRVVPAPGLAPAILPPVAGINAVEEPAGGRAAGVSFSRCPRFRPNIRQPVKRLTENG
jgi:hypothetical protein